MNTYTHLFDATDVDTPAGMTPAVDAAVVTVVPSAGTGLAGEVYVNGESIWNTTRLQEVIDTTDPVLTFTASKVAYADNRSETTIAEFLDHDAASIQGGTGDEYEMGPSGLKLTGFIYIPPGVHEVAVSSDDGFELTIGGVDFSEFTKGRGTDTTARVADFEGGLYPIEMIYFDGGGSQSLLLEIDGLPVDESALYLSVDDFNNPPANVPLVPVEDYHPSAFVAEALDIATTDTGTDGVDVIQGGGADEDLSGGDGDDSMLGGYGDDTLDGGNGDDVLQGGRGSDLMFGGAGNDLLISESDVGEQRIGQLAIGQPTREDPDGEVNQDRQKLYGYEGQPLIGDDVMFGGDGEDTFLIAPLLNAKLEIIQKHTRKDGSINWAGVAGENNELHDHWTDAFGIEVIGDYVAEDDQIAVIGHTAAIGDIEYRDVDGDGDDESIITVISQQHGGGGAHTQDLLGQIVVFGDIVEEDDIVTNAGVTYGIVENYKDVAEAIAPVGELKTTDVGGQEVPGYDTRDDQGNLGAVTGAPEDNIDNPAFNDPEVVSQFGEPSDDDAPELTRDPFEPLPVVAGVGVSEVGTGGKDIMGPTEVAVSGLPGALAYYSFADTGGADGAFEDARGGPTLKTYTQYENQALLRTDALTTGPDGTLNALEFNGTDEFAFVPHDDLMAVTQGTIAMWVRSDDLDQKATFVSKDQSGLGEGGHFRLGQQEDGRLLLRMAEGDGRWGNNAWETKNTILTEGEWTHLAVNFTEDGVVVYVDGKPIGDNKWEAVSGDVKTPGKFSEAYMVQNAEPWVLGADSYRVEDNDTAQQFATGNGKLDRAFEGAIAEFGVWGGFTPDDALSKAEIADLIANGPGAALTNPSGPQPLVAADDMFDGAGGNDIIDGGAGNDTLKGGAGKDTINGGDGDDSINGGDGNDVLDGGRGSDLVIGGKGNDTLYARSDAGEQRAGQLVLGEPSRDFPDPSIDPEYLKLVDWVDHPMAADDVLVGGEGKDHFYIEPLINAKKDIIVKHTDADRTIDWARVAGENRRIHDHWVDLFGIDIIADYNKDEDQISVIGHTANILDIEYKTIDTDDDGVDDDVVSVVTVYSQQGNNGGAHDEDILGYVVVHGDLVTEDDINTNPKVTPGIVDTIDQLQEAVAPTGETKISTAPDGTEIYGYDSRDIEGNPLAADPEAYSSNPFLAAGQVEFAKSVDNAGPVQIIAGDPGGVFDGTNSIEIAHTPDQASVDGAWAFTFTADDPALGRDQVMLSKDHSGYKTGGHMSIYLDGEGRLKARFQSETESTYLVDWGLKIAAGEEHHVAFTYTKDTIALYLDGELVDADDGFKAGMRGNTEDTAIGASTRQRWQDEDRLQDFFVGEIVDVENYDRALDPAEVVLLSNGDPIGTVSGSPDPLPDPLPAPDPLPDPGSTPDAIVGDDTDNTLKGTNDDDEIIGGGGNDKLSGRKGDDVLDGGDGDDRLIGHAGSDTLFGGEGDDMLAGKDGMDTLFGGADDDRLTGKSGEDVLSGGTGNDKMTGGADADAFQFALGDGVDLITDFGVGGADTIDFSGHATFNTFADVQARLLSNAKGDAVISEDGTLDGPETITLSGVSAASLEQSDFTF